MTSDDIANRFDYHAPDAAKRQAHESVRRACRDLADSLNEQLPESREKSLVMTNLEQVMFWATAALARQA